MIGLATIICQFGTVRSDDFQEKRIKNLQPLPALEDPRSKINPRAFHPFVNACILEQMRDIQGAADSYRRALQHMPQSYEIRYSYARALFTIREFQRMREVLASITPLNAEVLYLVAASYRAQGQDDSARTAYLESALIDSSLASVYSFLASQYQQLNDLDSTIWAYEHMARLNPDDFVVFYELGRLHVMESDLQGARLSFDSSIVLNGSIDNMLTYVHLGDLFQLMDQPDSALSIYRKAHQLAPDNLALNRVLSAYYLSTDAFELALPYTRFVAEAVPDERASQHRLGIIYYVLDSLKAADSILSVLSISDPGDARLHYYLGRIAFSQENYERARTELTSVIQLSDSVFEGYVDLGFVYRRLEQPEREFETLLEGLASVQDTVGQRRLLMALGAAYEQADRVEKSVETFEQLLDLSPEFAPAMNYLGYLLADRGLRLDYAKDLLTKALAQEPENAAYLDSYGWIAYRMGDWEEAVEFLNKAAELDNDPTILDHLGDAYQQIDEGERARHWWQKALERDPDNQTIREKLSH
jgi:tetratricopeptide (TPR) repeat protein